MTSEYTPRDPREAAVRRWGPGYARTQNLAALQPDLRDGSDKSPGSGWRAINRAGPGPADRDWSDLFQAFADTLEAWRYNAWVRQVVRLTTAYVAGDVGDSSPVSSKRPEVQAFIDAFWTHPENKLARRLSPWCDELTRAGELFPVLFTNKFTGMSHVRAIPAAVIMGLETDPEDYEKELAYHQQVPGRLEPKVWKSPRTARPGRIDRLGRRYKPEPVMLHFAVNKPVGATRGESDLTPLLPWAQRYTEWLKDRVVFGKIRNKMALLWVKINDEAQLEDKREEYRSNPPGEAAVHVTGPDEEISFPSARIEGGQAEPDGKALRLAMATAANLSLVHFGEGDTANLSTTVSMDDRTFRTNSQRQGDFGDVLLGVVEEAYRRFRIVEGQPVGDEEDLQLSCEFPDISRSDNSDLATAAREAVAGLAQLGETLRINTPAWREFAFGLAMKFAGEILPVEEIKTILGEADDAGTTGTTGARERDAESKSGHSSAFAAYAAGVNGRGPG